MAEGLVSVVYEALRPSNSVPCVFCISLVRRDTVELEPARPVLGR